MHPLTALHILQRGLTVLSEWNYYKADDKLGQGAEGHINVPWRRSNYIPGHHKFQVNSQDGAASPNAGLAVTLGHPLLRTGWEKLF